MTFTSISETQDKVLEVENFNLVYKVPLRKRSNMRDVFSQFLTDPIEAVFPQMDRLHVAKNFNFTVRKGERIGILGINGAGKTSLCRCIAGMFSPTSGKIRRYCEVRGVFNTYLGIQPELTGRENAELLAHFIFPDHPNIKELVAEAVDFSELGHFADVPFKLYSNGMQTRLCLSLVSSQPAGLLILDEVFEGADMFFREKVSARVNRVMESSGAVLFVSHVAEQVQKVCTRVLVLNDGVIVFDGPTEKGIKFYESLRPL